MANVYTFTPTIQRKILALLWLDSGLSNFYQDIIQPKYFSNPVFVDLCRIIFDYQSLYKESPTIDVLTQEIEDLCSKSKQKVKEDYLECIDFMSQQIWDLEEYEYLKDKILSFGKRQALVEAIMKSANILEKEPETKYVEIEKLIKSALLVGENSENLGINFFENMEERFFSYSMQEDVIERIPTGIEKLDGVLGGGLGRTELGVVVAAPGRGKALDPNTKILTPTGYQTLKDLKIGDQVISVDGSPTNITAIYHHTNKNMYKVKFLYGGECICCDEHLWTVQTRSSSDEWVTLSLKDMIDHIRVDEGHCNYNIPILTEPSKLQSCGEITLHPWLLGVFIGSGFGYSTFTCHLDTDLLVQFNKLLPDGLSLDQIDETVSKHKILWNSLRRGKCKDGSYSKHPFRLELEKLGLYGKKSYNKFIPKEYLFSSPENRLSILQGILDSRGSIFSHTSVKYTTPSKQLIQDVKFLAESLGCITSNVLETLGKYTKNEETIETIPQYSIVIRPVNGIQIFSSKTKLSQLKINKPYKRLIQSVEYVGQGDAICITVDHPSKLYVIQDGIVTHNTTVLISIGAAALEAGYNVLHISLENNEKQIARNYDVRLLHKDKQYIRDNPEYSLEIMNNIRKYRRGQLRIKKYPTKTITVRTIRALLDSYKSIQDFEPTVLILDYGALLKPTNNYADKRNAIESNFEEMRALADEYNLALWSAAQGNRGALSKKVVTMSDLAECFAIANIADVMVCLCQTIKEKVDGKLRLFMPKIRDNADTMMLEGTIDYPTKKIEMHNFVKADDLNIDESLTPQDIDGDDSDTDWDSES